jgi:UDP-2,3-diacylglucosamine pyrophosphatase LpxH
MASESSIHKALDKALKSGASMCFEASTDKLIIFSDHHRGRRDGADDFLICEANYMKALEYYDQKDFHLMLLGDVEEFWENPLPLVMKQYKQVCEKEKSFSSKGKLTKVWGNHDDAWQFPSLVRTHLHKFMGPLFCPEAIRLEVEDQGKPLGKMLLVHGHQGNLASDRFAGISKFFVRFVWRNVQRVFKIPLTTPRKDKGLKSAHDQAFYNWAASKESTAVVCGHTHQPVFTSKTHIDALKDKLLLAESEFEKKKIQGQIHALREEFTSLQENVQSFKPCYFNTGCCSFSDGDITGIELNQGQIALIKWNDKGRKLIDSCAIRSVFEDSNGPSQ